MTIGSIGKVDPMLKGKWALVTGATAGLGQAVAESLADAGVNIVLHDLVEPRRGIAFAPASRLMP